MFNLSTILPSLLAITSLLASAYTLYFLPLPPQEVQIIEVERDAKRQATRTGYRVAPWGKQSVKPERRPVPYISSEIAELLAAHIVTVNRAIGGLLALLELWKGKEWSDGFMVGGGFLPLLICVIVLWARTELRIIDMDALEKLKARGIGEGQGS